MTMRLPWDSFSSIIHSHHYPEANDNKSIQSTISDSTPIILYHHIPFALLHHFAPEFASRAALALSFASRAALALSFASRFNCSTVALGPSEYLSSIGFFLLPFLLSSFFVLEFPDMVCDDWTRVRIIILFHQQKQIRKFCRSIDCHIIVTFLPLTFVGREKVQMTPLPSEELFLQIDRRMKEKRLIKKDALYNIQGGR